MGEEEQIMQHKKPPGSPESPETTEVDVCPFLRRRTSSCEIILCVTGHNRCPVEIRLHDTPGYKGEACDPARILAQVKLGESRNHALDSQYL